MIGATPRQRNRATIIFYSSVFTLRTIYPDTTRTGEKKPLKPCASSGVAIDVLIIAISEPTGAEKIDFCIFLDMN
jgi:hypothetical protein